MNFPLVVLPIFSDKFCIDYIFSVKFIYSLISIFLQVVYSDVYMLDDEMKWKTLPPMPKPDSHIEFAWAIVSEQVEAKD